MGNSNLQRARKAKNDEFYTRISDVERELRHYRKQLKGKTIFMNCDDPEESNFWRYFYLNFDFLGLNKIISTHYHETKSTYKLEYDGEKVTKTPLEQNGDFRSPEAIEILKEVDVVITNPPFSLYREYISQLMEYEKDFLIIGNFNSVTYKDVFEYIRDNQMWLGHSPRGMDFNLPDGTTKNVNSAWFTNLEHNKRKEDLRLGKTYSEEEYPTYDNYDAINVDRVLDIPVDYNGIMGVPITFLTKHNPEQFEIVGSRRWAKNQELLDIYTGDAIPPESDKKTMVDGKETYDRIFIKKKE